MGKKNAVVPVEEKEGALATMSPEEVAAMYAEDSGENLDNVNDAFYRISTKGSRYKVDEKLIGGEGISFSAIVLREVPVNVYYIKGYDPSDIQPPDCSSLGGLKPDSDIKEPQSEDCLNCPKNRYGSGTDQKGQPSKGKACANTRRLILKVDGVDLPAILSLPPTSTRSINGYLKALSNHTDKKSGEAQPLPLAAVMTKFAFDSSVEWPQPIMDLDHILPVEQYLEIREERQSPAVQNALTAFASGKEHSEGEKDEDSDKF